VVSPQTPRGAYSAPEAPLAVSRGGATSKGRGGEGRGGKGRGEDRKGR